MKRKTKYRTKVMVPETQTHDSDPVMEELLRVVREFDEFQKLQEDNEKEVG